jgi:tetratricopeptide (TPR) repeat protein
MYKILILLFILSCFTPAVKSQSPQEQMKEAVSEMKKQVADLDKQIADAKDPEIIKELKSERDMLKKSLTMMEGLDKNLSKLNISDSVINEYEQLHSGGMPRNDAARIKSVSLRIMTDAQMLVYLRTLSTEVEKLLPAEEKKEALDIYNEAKAKYKSAAASGNAASGCWMAGHWEKALFIMGRACLDDMSDADNLSNYAAFLSMSGGEQVALPILYYLNNKYRKNSTLLNNIGQAWFGLGDKERARKYLDSATLLYPNHSEANETLGRVHLSNGDTSNSIESLKRSIKEAYDPDKEALVNQLGGKLRFSDMPPLNYPMKRDPLGILPLMNSMPRNYQSSVDDKEKAFAIKRYLKGVRNLRDELIDRNAKLEDKATSLVKRLAFDSSFRTPWLEAHNNPAWKTADRSLLMLYEEKQMSPLLTRLLLPFPRPFEDINKVKTVAEVLAECEKLYHDSVELPIRALHLASYMPASNRMTCAQVDAITNAYLRQAADIRKRGTELIVIKIGENIQLLDYWIKYHLYGIPDNPPTKMNDLAYALIGGYIVPRNRWLLNQLETFVTLITHITTDEGVALKCDEHQIPERDEAGDELARLIVTELKCEFSRVVELGPYDFELKCNTINYNQNSKLRNRKSPVPKGSVHSGNRNRSSRQGGPQTHRGPFSDFSDISDENVLSSPAPLAPEADDPSRYYIEFDQWGNMVGLSFQLNNDGTGLADPAPAISIAETRWSWNATASGMKNSLNKLTIK